MTRTKTAILILLCSIIGYSQSYKQTFKILEIDTTGFVDYNMIIVENEANVIQYVVVDKINKTLNKNAIEFESGLFGGINVLIDPSTMKVIGLGPRHGMGTEVGVIIGSSVNFRAQSASSSVFKYEPLPKPVLYYK